jgi:hypothetical protein
MDKLYKSNKSCFLIPLHPPDYIYLHNLELIVKKCNVQVYIVLSNRDETIEEREQRIAENKVIMAAKKSSKNSIIAPSSLEWVSMESTSSNNLYSD